jgi:hypothetical protein
MMLASETYIGVDVMGMMAMRFATLIGLITLSLTFIGSTSPLEASTIAELLGTKLGRGDYRDIDRHWSLDRCIGEMEVTVPDSQQAPHLRQALCCVEAFLHCRSFVAPSGCGDSLLHGWQGPDDAIAIYGSYAYDAYARMPLDISLKRYRVTGIAIEPSKHGEFFAWIEVESQDCRRTGTETSCGLLLTPGQKDRREYFGFADAGTEETGRIKLWGPMSGSAGDSEIADQSDLAGWQGKVRHIRPADDMWNCLDDHDRTSAGAAVCGVESMLSCLEFDRFDRCAEVGWFKDGPRHNEDDVNILFGPAYFNEPDPDILRGLRQALYRIVAIEPHYRGYPNVALVTVELRLCYSDEPEDSCTAETFSPNKTTDSYLVWFHSEYRDAQSLVSMGGRAVG